MNKETMMVLLGTFLMLAFVSVIFNSFNQTQAGGVVLKQAQMDSVVTTLDSRVRLTEIEDSLQTKKLNSLRRDLERLNRQLIQQQPAVQTP